MDGITMTANQWNKLTYLYVDVPLIYLLGFSVSIWHNNCKIRCYGYDDNKISAEGIKMLIQNKWSQLKNIWLGNYLIM